MSKNKKSTFGLQLGQLAGLFAIAAKDQVSVERDCGDEPLAERLRRQLSESISENGLLFTAVSEISKDQQCDVTSLTGRSLQDVLFSPEAGAEQLQILKEASKRLTTTSTSEAERAVATTLYHAAIASGLVHHGKKITHHSYDKLDESFAVLIKKKWMGDELAELFSQARHICQNKRSKK